MFEIRGKKMKKLFFLGFIFFIFITICSSKEAFGIWEGPTEVIIAEWGIGEKQFGFEHGDTYDLFPTIFDISKEGLIVVTDGLNGRFKVFNPNGTFLRNIVPPVENPKKWVVEPKFIDSTIMLALNKYFFFSTSGEVLTSFVGPRKKKYWGGYNGKLYIEQIDPIYKWFVYSSTGELLKTYTEKPIELGVITEQHIGEGQYKVTVKYPDKKWVIIGEGRGTKYIRDICGNLYCEGDLQVIRYDEFGNEIDRLTLPKKRIEKISNQIGRLITKDFEEYGSIKLAPNGDVFAWKRTPKNYGIVKWTWQGDPDAPQDLKVTSSIKGFNLTWLTPIINNENIKGYEIYRSCDGCGFYKKLGTVNEDVLKYEDKEASSDAIYCYKVRAIIDKNYTGFSNEAIGKK